MREHIKLLYWVELIDIYNVILEGGEDLYLVFYGQIAMVYGKLSKDIFFREGAKFHWEIWRRKKSLTQFPLQQRNMP